MLGPRAVADSHATRQWSSLQLFVHWRALPSGLGTEASNSWKIALCIPPNRPPSIPVFCYLYHLSCVIVVHTSLVLKNNLNTWTRDYVIGTGGHKCATIFCPNSFRLVTDMHLRRRGGWTFIWGNAQIIGQYFPLPEVGTPPPHNSGKVYWPVARNVHTKYS